MKYKDYIELGFERVDLDCNVEFDESGYGGFALSKAIAQNVVIEAVNGELDKPKIYIELGNGSTIVVHTTCEDVQNIVKKLNATTA